MGIIIVIRRVVDLDGIHFQTAQKIAPKLFHLLANTLPHGSLLYTTVVILSVGLDVGLNCLSHGSVRDSIKYLTEVWKI